MHGKSAEYYRAREIAERKAAESAACPEARRAHEQMAQAYAQLVRRDCVPLTVVPRVDLIG